MDLITLGEALIDLPSTQNGVSLADAPGFAKVPAGAPANVAVAAARLGLGTAFITKVGADAFGDSILQTFKARGVDVSQARPDPAAHTGLAFVSIEENGERDFLFYFDVARDLALRVDELDREFLQSARAFHYGSISLIAEPSRTTTLTAARIARTSGALISYDPNLRPRLWPDEETMRRVALAGFAEATVAKVSVEEALFLVPHVHDLPELMRVPTAVGHLLEANTGLSFVAVTDGDKGSAAYDRRHMWQVPGFVVKAVDATGAGDAFTAGLLTFLLRQGPDLDGTLKYISTIIKDALTYANACGALAATERGAAMQALSKNAVRQLISSVP
jgi:fructokinase